VSGRGAAAGPSRSPPSDQRRRAAAPDPELARVEEAPRDLVRAGGFLGGPERHGVRDLADTLRRARLTRREARLWLAALRRLGRRLAQP